MKFIRTLGYWVVSLIFIASLISFIQLISFWGIYLTLTSEVTSPYLVDWEFTFSLLLAAIGSAILQVVIFFIPFRFYDRIKEKWGLI
ncbi:hypothetical protein LCGC14_1509160 [marine sediment metagenome]|uniref:Uncharacterized protein n=1 Tax=marine sediment metagenome TaxID=412755 RepID=A0A0F9M332_9ZZZZ